MFTIQTGNYGVIHTVSIYILHTKSIHNIYNKVYTIHTSMYNLTHSVKREHVHCIPHSTNY